MGSSFRYLVLESDRDLVVEWFRALPERPVEVHPKRGLVLYFAALGPLIGSLRLRGVEGVTPEG